MGDRCMFVCDCVLCVFIGDMDVLNVMCVSGLLSISIGGGDVLSMLHCCSD